MSMPSMELKAGDSTVRISEREYYELREIAALMEWLRDRLQQCPVSVSEEIGLPPGWTDLLDALRSAKGESK